MAEQRSDLRHRMAEKHEEHLAEILGARKTRGSGNQWANPMDARQSRYDETVAFAVDGKSTLARSITITRDMLDKAVEQAGAERPMIGVRFYDDERLRGFEDWMMLREDELLELLHWVNALSAISKEWGAIQEEGGAEVLADNVIGEMPMAFQRSIEAVPEMRGVIGLVVVLTASRMVGMMEMAMRTA